MSLMLFSVRADSKVCKHEAIFRPPLTQKKIAWSYFPSALCRDGK